MPIYDYCCAGCGENFELIILKAEPQSCPTCGGKLEKKVSKANFELKGKGWAKDRYAA